MKECGYCGTKIEETISYGGSIGLDNLRKWATAIRRKGATSHPKNLILRYSLSAATLFYEDGDEKDAYDLEESVTGVNMSSACEEATKHQAAVLN